MKKLLKYIALIIIMSGCSQFEPADENLLGEDRVNYDPDFAEGLLLKAYQNIATQISSTDELTDDATNNYNSWQRRMAAGEWNADNPFTNRWWHYEYVIYLNKFLTVIDNVAWKYDSESDSLFRDRYYGEAHALRGLRYYWILQEHAGYSETGELLGVQYIDEWTPASADFNIPRLTFAETVNKILADFDTALLYLPIDYDGEITKAPERYAKNDPEKYQFLFGDFMEHRISGRIINAFKAKLHLLAASPAFLNGAGHYEQAAELAAELINDNGGVEGIDMEGHHNFYTVVEGDLGEYFWRRGGGIGTYAGFDVDNFPPSLNGFGRINPSQNLVDAFYMNTGYPATEANGYNPSKPYSNRDRRLSLYVLHDGNDLNRRIINTGVGKPNDGLNAVQEKSTRTGYYLKKHLWEMLNITTGGSTSEVKKRDVFLRYTELYLLFAEAANEVGGPTYTIEGMSAADVIRKIRERAMSLTSDPYLDEVIAQGKDAMRQLIRNERRLELCFEGHRFYDLRRWGLLDQEMESLKGMRIDGSTYSIIEVDPRTYPEHGNYAPIPKSEVLKFSNLKQNRGW